MLVYFFRMVLHRSRLVAAGYYQAFALLDISKEMKGRIDNPVIDQLLLQQLPLKTGSAGIMEEFLNTLMDRKWRNKRFVEDLYPQALLSATEILELLKREYNLE